MGWRLGLGRGPCALAAASPAPGLPAVQLAMQDARARALLGRLSRRSQSPSIAATTLPASQLWSAAFLGHLWPQGGITHIHLRHHRGPAVGERALVLPFLPRKVGIPQPRGPCRLHLRRACAVQESLASQPWQVRGTFLSPRRSPSAGIHGYGGCSGHLPKFVETLLSRQNVHHQLR